MEFFKCSIGEETYGAGLTEIEKGIAERNGMKIEVVLFFIEWMKEVVLFKEILIVMT